MRKFFISCSDEYWSKILNIWPNRIDLSEIFIIEFSVSVPRSSSYAESTSDAFYATPYHNATAHVTSTTVSPPDSISLNYGQQYPYYPYHQQPQISHPLTSPMSPATVSSLPGETLGKDQAGSPHSDSKDGPTYDWMKIRRNPPKTTRK